MNLKIIMYTIMGILGLIILVYEIVYVIMSLSNNNNNWKQFYYLIN